MNLSTFNGDWSKVNFLNLMMIDLRGNLRSVTLPREYATEKVLRDGIGFDGSNYGYAKVSNSDMVAVPDMGRALLERRGEFNTVHVFCDVVSATDERIPFEQYPRNVVRNAARYLRDKKIADDAKMLVELEYYAFDQVEYTIQPNRVGYSVATAEGLGDDFSSAPRFGLFDGYHRVSPEDRYRDFRDTTVELMGIAGVPVKYHHHEFAVVRMWVPPEFPSMEKTACPEGRSGGVSPVRTAAT